MLRRRLPKIAHYMKENLLTILIVISVVLATTIGGGVRLSMDEPLEENDTKYLFFMGSILMRMLKCVATPLIITCIICALGSMNFRAMKILGWQIVVLLFITNFISVVISLVLVVSIYPGGVGKSVSKNDTLTTPSTLADAYLDMVRNTIPNNLVTIFLREHITKLTPPEEYTTDYYAWGIQGTYKDGMNFLGAIAVSIIIGQILSIISPRGDSFLQFIISMNKILMLTTEWILWSAGPLVFCMIMAEMLTIDDLHVFATTWGMFLVTSIIEMFVMTLLVFPVILVSLTQTNPWKFYVDMGEAFATGFGTGSNIATLPIAMQCLEQHGIDKRSIPDNFQSWQLKMTGKEYCWYALSFP